VAALTQERAAAILEEERATGELAWWYMSFADSSRPKGQQWLGACIVEGYGLATATRRSWELGVNPGGGVLAGPIPPEAVEKFKDHFNKLYRTREELETVFGPADRVEGPG
jgi:hypothetical protein